MKVGCHEVGKLIAVFHVVGRHNVNRDKLLVFIIIEGMRLHDSFVLCDILHDGSLQPPYLCVACADGIDAHGEDDSEFVVNTLGNVAREAMDIVGCKCVGHTDVEGADDGVGAIVVHHDVIDSHNWLMAFAQGLYLLDHGYQPKPDQEESQLISQHNSLYIEPNDCEEVLKTFLRKPEKEEQGIALSAGDILTELGDLGHRGRSFSTSEIGKAMKRMNFESKRILGYTKYLVVLVDRDIRHKENEADSREFIPDVFE